MGSLCLYIFIFMHLDKQMAKYGGNKGVEESPSSCLNLGAPSTGEIGWGKKGQGYFCNELSFLALQDQPRETQCERFNLVQSV